MSTAPQMPSPTPDSSASAPIGNDDDGSAALAHPAPLAASVRTAPRVLPIVGLGAGLGILLALILAVAAPGGEDYSVASAFGYLAVLFGIVGALLGGIAALIIDRISLRRAQDVTLRGVDDPELQP